ncbi:MAG: 16S rRNA (guanine(966)-N(2))-methyltransferase RsmD, partial [Bacteroidota bacterium]
EKVDLRIISGIYKNRNIKIDPKAGIRPTLVRSRKTIFDTIYSRIGKIDKFLDVFAGSGVMGMEAMSRGADDVVFFEINKTAIRYIEKNLRSMEKLPGKYSVLNCNALRPFEGQSMDVVFLDPPYDKYFIIPDVLKKLQKYGWIGQNTIVVIEYFYKNKIKLSSEYKIFKDTKVSNSVIQFFTYLPEEDFTDLLQN